ncbi:MAG: hypothetical protein IID32_11345, partial [Planctomycetes bacterium]|nr:hypothetical protein [Planctomycetota bacterium]
EGGGGVDTASYLNSTSGLTISLADNTKNTGEAKGDTYDAFILNIDGSFYDDVLIGNDLNNVLRGLEGDDLIIDSMGDDTLDGGFGEDTLSYETATAGVTVDLGDGERQETIGAGKDLIVGIENLIGSIYADSLTGNDGDNILIGGRGGDTLNGGGGNDTASYINAGGDVTADLRGIVTGVGDALGDSFAEIENLTGSDHHDVLHGDGEDNILNGGLGNDNIFGWGGDDFLIGDLGIDQLDGGAGTDAVSYLYSDSEGGVTARLGGTADDGVHVDTMLVNLEILIGSNFDDVLIGDGNNNILIGGLGDDVLEGRGGEDILSGGAGNDTASYANAPVVTGPSGGVTVSLADPAQNTGEATNDRYILVENLIGSAFDDRLIGDRGDNILMGGPGADYLDGGGDGIDLVSYANASKGLTVDLLTPANNTGEAAGDTYTGMGGIIGSAFNDSLFGDDGNNILIGGLGDDYLDGRLGNDTASYITLDVSAGETGVTVDLGESGIQNTIVAGNDQLIGFENLEGTRGNDILIGDSGDNIIFGHGGADVISGGGGNDIFVAGSGDDTYGLSEGADSLTIIDPEKLVFTASDRFIVKGDLNLISGTGIELGENVLITPTGSGNVSLSAPDILLKPGSEIITDGDITLTASNSPIDITSAFWKFLTRAAFRLSPFELHVETAKVELDNAILEGNDITIEAITDTTTIYDTDPKGKAEGFLGFIESLIDFIDFKLFAGVAHCFARCLSVNLRQIVDNGRLIVTQNCFFQH